MMIAAVAGTFSVLHDGHKELIRKAFEEGDRVLVGITNDAMTSAEGKAAVPLHIRRKGLEEFLSSMNKPSIVFEIDDIYGPRDLMDPADVLVVTEETLPNAKKVNDDRAKRGVAPLRVSVVPLKMAFDDSKISSSDILKGRYARNGDGDVMDIAVGSANFVKVEAVRSVMERIFGDVRITPLDVCTGVPEQPFGDDTVKGAANRATNAIDGHDLSVGIEAGVFETPFGLYDFQYCAILDKEGKMTVGTGMGFRYPDKVAELVREGDTVGEAVKKVYGNTDIGKKQGAIGLLSKGLIDRKALTEQSVTAAMVPRIWDE
ncbi:MAG: inosine/xanthosine triphosphatase [Candidatus Methanoplasma sp.]|jgi:inosine/xanthosine triphosphatase|nr:inosine/xanthosine triphosphatase [Candidatus Methanoplasma sp.]